MGNERKLRLIQVAKEFKVGLNTITDFLQKKGIKSDGSPNTLVDAETYAVLEKEFGSNRSAVSARDSIRERISQKQTTITLEEAKKQEREEEKGGCHQKQCHQREGRDSAAEIPGEDRPFAQTQDGPPRRPPRAFRRSRRPLLPWR